MEIKFGYKESIKKNLRSPGLNKNTCPSGYDP